jgi:hypothetical protein
VAAAYNGLPDSGTAGRGVAAVSWATANFGDQSANPGNNAFSENVNCDFENGKPSSSINAKNNQWRSGSPNLCLASGASVVTSPVQSGPNSAMSIDTSNPVIPSNRILKGQTLRVRGLGFNAIGGNPVSGCVKGVGNLATQDSCCRVKSKGNTCQGTHDPTGSGNCVELEIQAGSVGALQVTSVTPTTIVTEIANDVHACLGEQANEKVWVTKRNSAGTPVPRSGTYCRNADL